MAILMAIGKLVLPEYMAFCVIHSEMHMVYLKMAVEFVAKNHKQIIVDNRTETGKAFAQSRHDDKSQGQLG